MNTKYLLLLEWYQDWEYVNKCIWVCINYVIYCRLNIILTPMINCSDAMSENI